MNFKNKYLLGLLALLAACSAGDKAAQPGQIPPNQIASPISLRITSQMETDQTFTRTTFVPNLTASWLSQMILVSAAEQLYQTSANQPSAKQISTEYYADVLGLVRKNQAGIFLSLDRLGAISAFVEASDEADYEAAIYSGSAPALSKFCQDNRQTEARLPNSGAVIDDKGRILSFHATITADNAVSFAVNDNPFFDGSPAIQCVYAPSGDLVVLEYGRQKRQLVTLSPSGAKLSQQETLLEQFALIPMPDAQFAILGIYAEESELYMQTGQNYHPITIENGLSIAGADKINMIAATDINMGSTFGQGVIVMQEPGGTRLMFISLSYAQDVLKDYLEPQ